LAFFWFRSLPLRPWDGVGSKNARFFCFPVGTRPLSFLVFFAPHSPPFSKVPNYWAPGLLFTLLYNYHHQHIVKKSRAVFPPCGPIKNKKIKMQTRESSRNGFLQETARRSAGVKCSLRGPVSFFPLPPGGVTPHFFPLPQLCSPPPVLGDNTNHPQWLEGVGARGEVGAYQKQTKKKKPPAQGLFFAGERARKKVRSIFVFFG